MQRIDKADFRAGAFLNYLEEYKGLHANRNPNYSSNNPHYPSVFMALLICQQGLCAYTEECLSNVQGIDVWNVEHEYDGDIEPKKIDGDIDHFDATWKHDGRGWEIDNLFICKVHNNRKIKLAKPVVAFMKPDLEDYNPDNFITYDFDTHQFVALPSLQIDDLPRYTQVKSMIETLGINNYTTISKREKMLEIFKKRIENHETTYQRLRDEELYQFFTAFRMSENKLNGN